MAKFSTKSILPKFDEKAKAQGRLAALKSRTFTIPTHRARDWIWKLVSKHWIRLNLGWSFGFQVFSGLEEEKERLEEKLAQVFLLQIHLHVFNTFITNIQASIYQSWLDVYEYLSGADHWRTTQGDSHDDGSASRWGCGGVIKIWLLLEFWDQMNLIWLDWCFRSKHCVRHNGLIFTVTDHQARHEVTLGFDQIPNCETALPSCHLAPTRRQHHREQQFQQVSFVMASSAARVTSIKSQ